MTQIMNSSQTLTIQRLISHRAECPEEVHRTRLQRPPTHFRRCHRTQTEAIRLPGFACRSVGVFVPLRGGEVRRVVGCAPYFENEAMGILITSPSIQPREPQLSPTPQIIFALDFNSSTTIKFKPQYQSRCNEIINQQPCAAHPPSS
jgi:hypothetical protein